jgi:hypothetical protein
MCVPMSEAPVRTLAFGKLTFVQPRKGSTHTSVNERSPRLDDDRNLIAVAV